MDRPPSTSAPSSVGEDRLVVLGKRAVREMLSMDECIALLRVAMVSAIDPAARQPLRSFLPIPGHELDGLGIMPGYIPIPECFGAKVISVYPDNFSHGLPSHQGGVILFEPQRGRPLAFLHAGEITAIRTAAASALATDILANPDAMNLAILGYGEQAERHLESMALVRQLKRVRVWGRSIARARGFAERNAARIAAPIETVETVADALDCADIVCTTTASSSPILSGDLLRPGMHLNLVGSSKASEREVDDTAVARGRFFVDLKLSTVAQAGEYRSALSSGLIQESHILGQLGELVAGAIPGRRSRDEITIYKSLGISAQDLVCAHFLLEKAKTQQRGDWVAF